MKVHLHSVRLVPGLLVTLAVASVALMIERIELVLFGRAWLEGLVLAIVVGTIIRSGWRMPRLFDAGVHFSAKALLEVAVVLMGATISFGAIMAVGWPLLLGIVGTVIAAIVCSFMLGIALGLDRKVALLIACGNAICGNSAIAAVAPAIDADADDVATAIAFTAVLGVGVVLLLPLIVAALHLTPRAGGALAGLTVYAVPQVLAAAAPMGTAATQLGTLVKLVRVLALGPIVTGISLLQRVDGKPQHDGTAGGNAHILPGFILAFLTLATARSLALLPDGLVPVARNAGGFSTIIAMAGLGLGVDLRHVTAAGPRVVLTVSLSLAILGAIALGVIWLTGLA